MSCETIIKKGEMLFINDNIDEAEKVFKYVLSIKHNDPKALNNLGVIAFSRGDLKKAEKYFVAAILAMEGYADPILNIAHLYIKIEYWSKAIKYLEEFVKYHPSSNIDKLINQIKIENDFSIFREKSDMDNKNTENHSVKKTDHFNSRSVNCTSKSIRVISEIPLRILFVQEAPCIRNYKMAYALRSEGHIVSLAYKKARISQMYKDLKDEIYYENIKLRNYRHLWDISKHYDIIHCHNEPDLLSVAALAGDVPVVHDTHDLVSLRANGDPNLTYFEGIANRGASGRIYTTPYQLEEAKMLYGIEGPSLVFYNYASKPDLPSKFYQKLSDQDGNVHIVYEGGIGGNAHRDFRSLFVDIANKGFHIHIYPTYFDEGIDRYFNNFKRIHYYKPFSPRQIMAEMTKYDFGIIPFNIEKGNRRFLDSTIANKLFEYLSSGLPVIASRLKSYVDFFKQHPVGITFDNAQEIFNNLQKLYEIKNQTDFSKYIFTFEDEISKVVGFYRDVIRQKSNNNTSIDITNHAKNKEKKSSFYDTLYLNGGFLKQYHKHYTKRIDYDLWKQSLSWIKEIDNPNVLEIACGCGQYANMLFDNGIRVYAGIDFSNIAISMAKENNKEHSDLFYVGNALESDRVNADYNIVIIFEALEHIECDLDLLNRMRKDSTLILSVPNFPSESHVRYFESKEDIVKRYGSIMDIKIIQEFPIGHMGNLIYLIKGKK